MTQARRVSERVPPGVAAIVVGSAVYFTLGATGILSGHQGFVGTVPLSVPAPTYLPALAMLLLEPDTWGLLWTLLPAIISLAILNTMQTLIGAVTADNLAQTRSSADRELLGQGIGNFVSSLFGGVPLSGLISITVANHRSGGQTHLSRFTSGLFALAVLLVLGRLLAWLPTIVLVGLLLGLSTMLADLDTLRRLSSVFTERGLHRKDLQDLVVLCVVMLTMFVLGPIEGVLVGAGASVVTFLLNMATTNIHRQYRADWIRSNVQRGAHDYNLLVENGHKIVVIEVSGPLFFGTSDRLAAHVDTLVTEGPRTIILDFARVFDVDSTASKLLLQTANLARSSGVQLMFSGLSTNPRVEAFMASQPLLEQLAAHQVHGTLNEALAAAEDCLIDAHSQPGAELGPLSPRELDVLAPMSDHALTRLSAKMTRATFKAGEVICEQGAASDALYFLALGRLQVTVCNHEGLEQQIGVLCPGSIFGEMAFIDEAVRSASVAALEPASCYVLCRDALESLQATEPDVELELHRAMLMNLAKRLRILNRASAVFRDL
jgi:MFS superfamily sulfate permease-like transporter